MSKILSQALALALLGESFFAPDRGNTLRPEDINVLPPQSRPAKGCKEYFFHKNGGFYNGEGRPLRKDETVWYCHASSDAAAIKKFKKWEAKQK